MGNHRMVINLPITQIIKEYEVDKVSLNELERKYSVSAMVIKNRLIQAGVTPRTKRECYDLYWGQVTKQTEKPIREAKAILPVPLSSKRRFAILARDGFCCRYCGRSAQDGVELVVEHIIAKEHGGTDAPLNLVTACKRCNNSKGAASLVTNTGQIPSFILIAIPHQIYHNYSETPQNQNLRGLEKQSISTTGYTAKLIPQ